MLRSPTVQWTVGVLATLYMRIVRLTGRLDRPEPPPGGPFILATWHNRLFLLSYLRIGDRPLVEHAPLYRDGPEGGPVVQYDMKSAETVGLIKFDFLGLKTLDVITAFDIFDTPLRRSTKTIAFGLPTKRANFM